MDDLHIDVTESAQSKLATVLDDHPEPRSIRVFLQQGG